MSDQQNIDLVKEVEKYPSLYNCTLSTYSRKADTDKAWTEIGQKLNMSDDKCKRKWRNLRVAFTRHIRSSPIRVISGRKRKKYYLVDHMQFLLPFVRPTKTAAGLAEETLSETGDGADDIDDLADNGDDSDHGLYLEEEELESNGEGSELSMPDTKRIKSIPIKEEQHFVDCSQNPLTSDDAVTSFLNSLVPELKEMNLVQFKSFKRKVLSLIDDIMEPSAK